MYSAFIVREDEFDCIIGAIKKVEVVVVVQFFASTLLPDERLSVIENGSRARVVTEKGF